jgi:lipid-binding SYLF domain-containing protein
MKITHRQNLIAVALVCALTVTAHGADNKKEDQQKKVRTMAQDTLQRLYKADPKAKQRVEGANGYAVFTNMGVKILVAGSGKGQGIAVSNKSKKETFMKMLELQAGLGFGVKNSAWSSFLTTRRCSIASSTPVGNSADNPQPLRKPEARAERWPERRRFLAACGCIN